MKTLLRGTAVMIAIAAIGTPAPTMAQEAGNNVGLSFDLGFGSRNLPRYEGSDETMTRIWGIHRNLDIRIGPDDVGSAGPRQGFSLGPSFYFIDKRRTGATAPVPLRGLDPVDRGVELGLEAAYQAGPVRYYGAARKAVGGHHGVTGEMGVSLAMRPAPDWTLTPSVEAQYGNQRFMDAYFGISADEATRSGQPEYHADGGIKAYALGVEARWQATDNWSLMGRVQAKRLVGDAADSPIVKDRNQLWVGFGVVRNFNFRF